jgi:hypothetical protein
MSKIRGYSRVEIRGSFDGYDLNALASTMCGLVPVVEDLVDELKQQLALAEAHIAHKTFAEALLTSDIGAYLADHSQSRFDHLPNSPLENLFDDLRCKLSRMACEVKCTLINNARREGEISEDTAHWASKAIVDANDAFSFCGITDEDIGLTHLARARAYDLAAQLEVQTQSRISTQAAKLYKKASRDYLCALGAMGEVTEMENRLVEIESLLGEEGEGLDVRTVHNAMGVLMFEGDARLTVRWGEDVERRDFYLQRPK